MAYTPREGSGSLFKNSRKETEKHPDYNGSIMLNGKEYWLNAWIKEGKQGKFFSVSVGKEKLSQGFREAGADELPKADPFLDDQDIPF